MKFLMIVVLDCNWGIGQGNVMFWYLLDDFKYFKVFILGKLILMGCRMVELIGCVLLGWINLVLICSGQVLFVGMCVVVLLDEVKVIVEGEGVSELCIIGGGEIFCQLFDQVSDLYLIWVDVEVFVDIYFFEVDVQDWWEVSSELYLVDECYVYVFCFVYYVCC